MSEPPGRNSDSYLKVRSGDGELNNSRSATTIGRDNTRGAEPSRTRLSNVSSAPSSSPAITQLLQASRSESSSHEGSSRKSESFVAANHQRASLDEVRSRREFQQQHETESLDVGDAASKTTGVPLSSSSSSARRSPPGSGSNKVTISEFLHGASPTRNNKPSMPFVLANDVEVAVNRDTNTVVSALSGDAGGGRNGGGEGEVEQLDSQASTAAVTRTTVHDRKPNVAGSKPVAVPKQTTGHAGTAKFSAFELSGNDTERKVTVGRPFLDQLNENPRMRRIIKLWQLFGNEAVAVMLGLLEIAFIAATLVEANSVHSYTEWDCFDICRDPNSGKTDYQCFDQCRNASGNATSFVVIYSIRLAAETIALVLAACMGKYRNVGATPLALEWQPGKLVDSIVLATLMLSLSIGSLVTGNTNRHSSMAGDILFTIGGVILMIVAIALASFVWFYKKDLQKGGPTTIRFLAYARSFALVWEIYGAVLDISYIPLFATKSGTSTVSPALLVIVELCRSAWEFLTEMKGLKLSYAFNRMFVPLSARDKLLKLNTIRTEAVKSIINLDAVILIAGGYIASAELIADIMAMEDVLSEGPVGGGNWYSLLGMRERETRYTAWLAIQPLADSDFAWFDGDNIVLHFEELGLKIAAEQGKPEVQVRNELERSRDKAGRINTTEIWH